MIAPTPTTPCRGDFFATDTGTAVLKMAIENAVLARAERIRGNAYVAHVLRKEMRYYALIAVKIARRCRADRS